MTEVDKIKYAKSFIDILAQGYDPTTGAPAGESEVLKNIRVSRCLAYVSGILGEVIEAGGVPKPRVPRKKFAITAEQLANIRYSEEPVPISEFTRMLVAATGEEHMRTLPYRRIAAWLVFVGLLKEYETPDGHTYKLPTPDGMRLGITTVKRVGKTGEYTQVLYNKFAQQFLVDNLDAILAFDVI